MKLAALFKLAALGALHDAMEPGNAGDPGHSGKG
jgi:hypothetical protein